MSRYVVVIKTDDGLRGEYVTHLVATMASLAQTLMLAPQLIGRDPEMREEISMIGILLCAIGPRNISLNKTKETHTRSV